MARDCGSVSRRKFADSLSLRVRSRQVRLYELACRPKVVPPRSSVYILTEPRPYVIQKNDLSILGIAQGYSQGNQYCYVVRFLPVCVQVEETHCCMLETEVIRVYPYYHNLHTTNVQG
jgi:hypothetical protein